MIKRKLELLLLGSCAVPGLVWALMTDYFPHFEPQLDWLIDISSLLYVLVEIRYREIHWRESRSFTQV